MNITSEQLAAKLEERFKGKDFDYGCQYSVGRAATEAIVESLKADGFDQTGFSCSYKGFTVQLKYKDRQYAEITIKRKKAGYVKGYFGGSTVRWEYGSFGVFLWNEHGYEYTPLAEYLRGYDSDAIEAKRREAEEDAKAKKVIEWIKSEFGLDDYAARKLAKRANDRFYYFNK